MRSLRLISLLALAACASATTGSPPANPGRIIASGTTLDATVTTDGGAEVYRVNAAPEAAWIGLPGVFEALDVPLTLVDSNRKILGNPEHRLRGRLGGRPLAEYLSCGSNMSGPIANQYDIRLSLVSQLQSAEEGEETEVRTRVGATARSPAGASSSSVPCSSTGELEKRVAELLERSVGR